MVGLDADRKVALTGECRWSAGPFGRHELGAYLDHVRAMGDLVRREQDQEAR